MKKEYKILLAITFIWLIVFSIFNKWGSMTDYINQHTVILEYLRSNIYDGFKQLAINIGSFQNIFHLSYYGLFSPIMFLSLLFPFIEMIDFIIIINAIIYIITPLLLYNLFKKNKFNNEISLILSIVFILCGPFFFHLHRQVMFVNYFPFLIIGLFGIDEYLDNGKYYRIIISIVLLIMTSFYYSITSIICLILYGIYKYLIKYPEKNYKELIKYVFKIGLIILAGILLCSFFLLPTWFSLNKGRGLDSNIWQYLIPSFNAKYLIHDSYSIGLSSLGLIGLIYSISKKNKGMILGIFLSTLLFIPIFMYFLNGGLYVRAKVLIPLIPLLLLLLGNFLNDLFDNKINIKKIILLVAIATVLFTIKSFNNYLFYIDIIITIISIILYSKYKKKYYIYVPLITCMGIVFLSNNLSENYIKRDYYNQVFGNQKVTEIKKVLDNDNNVYRFNDISNSIDTVNKIYDNRYLTTSIYSSSYNNYYYDLYKLFGNPVNGRNRFLLSSNENILFQSYMGVKYIYSDYELENKISNNVYHNSYAYPIIYATSNLIANESFNKLKYPYNVEVLMNNAIVQNGQKNYSNRIQKTDLNYTYPNNIPIKKDGKYQFDAEDTVINVNISDDLNEKILIIEIKNIKSPSCTRDLSITINNIKNVLTCEEWLYHNDNNSFHYVLDSNLNSLEVIVGKGVYEFEEINTYVINKSDILNHNYDSFEFIDINKNIEGNINVSQDGYLVTSIPYDTGYKIKLDNQVIEYELVNTAFVGFPITKGKHNITIEYTSPYLKEGMVISTTVLSLFIIYEIVRKTIKKIEKK